MYKYFLQNIALLHRDPAESIYSNPIHVKTNPELSIFWFLTFSKNSKGTIPLNLSSINFGTMRINLIEKRKYNLSSTVIVLLSVKFPICNSRWLLVIHNDYYMLQIWQPSANSSLGLLDRLVVYINLFFFCMKFAEFVS